MTAVSLIRLNDGTLIDPATGEPLLLQGHNNDDAHVKHSDDDNDISNDDLDDDIIDTDLPITIRPDDRRSIMDLALNAEQMAVINNVLVYTLWGLPDDEIAQQCNCTQRQVAIVRDLDDYSRMHDALIQGLQQSLSSSVQGILADAAPKAAKLLVRNLNHKSADIKQSTIKDLLDRTGHRPADKVEHNHVFGDDNELVIRIIKQDDADAVPTLNLKAI